MSWKLLHCFIVLTTLHYVASLQPLPRVKGSGETITIAAGQTLQLQCIVENMPRKLKAKWERCRRMNEDGVCLSYSGLSSRNKPKFDRYSDLRQDAFNSYILSIYNIRVSQSGTYYCSVKTALLTKRTYDYIHVFVYEVPTIDPLSTTPDTVRMEGAPVQLNCKASGNPTPVVLWRKSGGSTLPGGNPKIRNTTLNLASCDQETKGIYMCVASNKYGTAVHTITLDCLGAPKIEPAPSIMYQKAGYQAKLSCTIFSSPEVTRVWWRKNGEDIPGDSQRYSVSEMKAALGRVITKLHLKDGVQNSDYESVYSCHVRNPLGYSQANITINESSIPKAVGGKLMPVSMSAGVVFSLHDWLLQLLLLVEYMLV